MPATGYLYELHRAGELIATGHLPADQTLEPGDTITIGQQSGTVHEIRNSGDTEPRIIVRLDP